MPAGMIKKVETGLLLNSFPFPPLPYTQTHNFPLHLHHNHSKPHAHAITNNANWSNYSNQDLS